MNAFQSIISGIAALFLTAATLQAQAFDHSHAALTEVLKKHMHGEMVDYAAIKRNPADLEAYLGKLAAVRKPEFDKWSREQQMAYLINLYNAATIKLVVDHYPIKSIRRIGGLLRSPWKMDVVDLFGKKVSLDHIEHDILRPHYKDARIHFAVNCASIGCPPLRREAFVPERLGAQMDEQARIFIRDKSKNHLDAKSGTLHLSPIFDWYKEDFIAASGSVQKYVAQFFPDAERAIIEKKEMRIRNTNYDWDLNKR